MKLPTLCAVIFFHAVHACEASFNTNLIQSLVRQIVHRRDKKAHAHLGDIIMKSIFAQSFSNRDDLRKRMLYAARKFHNVPGFMPTFTKTLRQKDQGHFHEIEAALCLTDESTIPPCSIIEFNRVVKCPSSTRNREIDLVVRNFDGSELWIECKCHLPSDPNEGLTHQFLDQQKIVYAHAKQTRKDVAYIICSKQPASEAWHAWFDHHDIVICEGESDSYAYDDGD